MRKINILSKNVYNRIAAGEVIDRPYSAVKELVENSLDAKATEIEIYIEKGGKQLIKVIDNGSGIDRDDMRAAFLPHATSKIATAEDLDTITTLGFRGEALASISVISQVELVSVTEGNTAYKVTCEDGKVGEIVPAALAKGTEITVRNLFYNTPVRAKFLKPDKKEETDVTSFITRYILGNPEVAFKYYVDGKPELQSFGGGLEEAVAQVYGAKTLSECFRLEAEKSGIRLRGYIGNQNYFKPNKTYQSLFLNGRYIINNTVSVAITQAYASYAMKRQYPFYVLFLDVPNDLVDVNVHPSKADVRFVDNNQIFKAVYSVISAILDGTAGAADFVIDAVREPIVKSTAPEEKEADLQRLMEKYKPEIARPEVQPKPEPKVEKPQKTNTEKEVKFFNMFSDMPLSDWGEVNKKNVMKVTDDTAPPDITNTAASEIENRYFERKQQRIDLQTLKYRGTLFNTYLIYEQYDAAFFIDQHAAHERLIFDKLMEKLEKRNIVCQPLLVPYIFDTNASEKQFIDEKLPLLRDMGFGIAPFGMGSYRIDEVPVDLQDINIKEFFSEILTDIEGLKEIKLENILKDKLAMAACKHAVKGGMQLTEAEIEALMQMLDGDMGLKCPHGRPVCLKILKRDIEKMFKRIV
ncbi:MAG: DNA mismatch repair endonuclease MutL [Clostridia bacterium]|nr:DNA mismatch repair endonuclease MutL [Clostridia bacterium]